MVKITFLGTGNAFGQDGRFPSCYLVETSTKKILLDCGPSILPALRKIGVSPGEIDIIILSHLHVDHCGGIPFFMLEDKWISKRKNPVKLYSPKKSLEHFTKICEILYKAKDVFHLAKTFAFIDFEVGDKIQKGDLYIEGLKAIHSYSPKMIYLKTEGKSIGYSGDSAFCESSFNRILGADLTIHECSSYNIEIPNHVNYLELVKVMEKKIIPKGKKIYLTHVDQSMVDNRKKVVDPFILAEDGVVVSLI